MVWHIPDVCQNGYSISLDICCHMVWHMPLTMRNQYLTPSHTYPYKKKKIDVAFNLCRLVILCEFNMPLLPWGRCFSLKNLLFPPCNCEASLSRSNPVKKIKACKLYPFCFIIRPDCFALLAMTQTGKATGLLRSARNDADGKSDWIAFAMTGAIVWLNFRVQSGER